MATLKVFNRLGALVFSMADARPAILHSWQWDGRDIAGRVVPAGVYFLQADAGADRLTAKAVRLR
jgi:flagellar hook assembly protein FlgD